MGNPIVHFEVIGSDADQLAKFYSELFGWHVEMLPEMGYGSVDTHAGHGINGGVGVSQDRTASYTTFYIAVPDLAATLKAIGAAGGTTLQEPMTIPDIVTFAQFQDPAGNRIGLIADDGTPPPKSESKGNPAVGWVEALGTDPDGLAKFYADIFGWKTKRNEMPGGMIYHEFDTDTGGAGTNGGIGSSYDGKPHVTIYAGVKDVTQSLTQAETLGGTIIMAETAVTPDTVIGQFTDPQGHIFGVYKAMP